MSICCQSASHPDPSCRNEDGEEPSDIQQYLKVPMPPSTRLEALAETIPDGTTTLMFRYIPRRFKTSDVLTKLDAKLDRQAFNYVYVPWDKSSTTNMGYAFVNFISTKVARAFLAMIEGTSWRAETNVPQIKITAAHMQGLSANVLRHATADFVAHPEFLRIFHLGVELPFQVAVDMLRQGSGSRLGPVQDGARPQAQRERNGAHTSDRTPQNAEAEVSGHPRRGRKVTSSSGGSQTGGSRHNVFKHSNASSADTTAGDDSNGSGSSNLTNDSRRSPEAHWRHSPSEARMQSPASPYPESRGYGTNGDFAGNGTNGSSIGHTSHAPQLLVQKQSQRQQLEQLQQFQLLHQQQPLPFPPSQYQQQPQQQLQLQQQQQQQPQQQQQQEEQQQQSSHDLLGYNQASTEVCSLLTQLKMTGMF